jgi:hypothetical protein
MKTITIDIINDKVLKLLQDLESLKLIKVRKEIVKPASEVNWKASYKGAMTKQTIDDIDNQLNELRNAWELINAKYP